MDILVLSGINLHEGGPLSIYYDCLDVLLDTDVNKKYRIIAFVHKKSLFEKYKENIFLIELPDSRDSYLKRLKYEYSYFYKFSQKHNIDIWISLHDITPRVKARKIYTYCHNPAPFMKKDLSKIKYSAINVAFSFFYKFLYRINVKSVTAMIVQHDWMRREFQRMYPVKSVIVARPYMEIDFNFKEETNITGKTIFIFASFPRYFKNFEVICEACKKIQSDEYEVWVTLDGSENSYAKDLYNKYSDIATLMWLGIQPREKIFDMYNQADCLIFPSILESWGLPISEFKLTGKGMLLADLPYAHETLGTYGKAAFFNPYDPEELAMLMEKVIRKEAVFQMQEETQVEEPFAGNWDELIQLIIDGTDANKTWS